jgi:hypothetical protein
MYRAVVVVAVVRRGTTDVQAMNVPETNRPLPCAASIKFFMPDLPSSCRMRPRRMRLVEGKGSRLTESSVGNHPGTP